MALPKIKHPIHDFVIPSTKKKEKFRPFLVKEEKLLLMAKESSDPADSLKAVKQVVNNCAISEKFDIDNLTMFDLEYLFLQLRAISVNNIVQVSYIDNEDKQIYNFEIDLKTVSVEFPEDANPLIKISDDLFIKMKWPTANILEDEEFLKSGEDSFYELILRCMDKIIDAEDVFECKDTPKKELEEFLDNCGVETFNQVQKFITSTPRVYHKLEYTNKNGNQRTIELTSLTDFFTLR